MFSAQAQDSLVIPLWKNGAPGFESRRNIPEEAKDWWVKNINDPTLTVFLPPVSGATRAAAIICPGGGHRALVFNSEGVQVAKFLNQLGIAAFVLKYRLFREDHSPYTPENAKQDVFRAIRLVKSMGKQFNIDTSNVGVIGFSAGGELAGWLGYHFTEQHFASHDAVDVLSARPAFQVLVYPGPLVVPDSVSANAPPTFLVAANNDTCCSPPVVTLMEMHRKAHVPVELHLYANGDHAFNMGARSQYRSLKAWPQRLADWFTDSGISPKKEK
ncbi:MAG TPA: alpha/beta hydrolase [Chitinophagaceae bacterium]|nr:alpha/beta hydrolase [Chitinophagaceae bacterium]